MFFSSSLFILFLDSEKFCAVFYDLIILDADLSNCSVKFCRDLIHEFHGLYDAEGIKAVANIPSRDELIAKFMGSIQSPVGKFVRTLAAIAEAKAGPVAEAPAEA